MLKISSNKIGVFDSGLGGLTVLAHFLSDLPYDYIYLGDTARLPYGEKSPENVYLYTKQGVEFLFKQGCSLVIIACNTASALALPKLQQEYEKTDPKKRILGVVRPLAEFFAQTDIETLGVLGTKATISSDTYQNEVEKLNPKIKIINQSAPLLVPLIEAGYTKKPATKMILKSYLRPLKQAQVQALILACTHYPFLLKQIRAVMGKKVLVPDPGAIVAKSLKDYLGRHPELKLSARKNSTISYYTSDDPEAFRVNGEKFLGQKIEKVKKVKLEQ